MNRDVPLAKVLAAVVPPPRPPAEQQPACRCSSCHEERARQRAREDWRNSRRVER